MKIHRPTKIYPYIGIIGLFILFPTFYAHPVSIVPSFLSVSLFSFNKLIHSFIHSGDLYSASSRDSDLEALPGQSRTKKDFCVTYVWLFFGFSFFSILTTWAYFSMCFKSSGGFVCFCCYMICCLPDSALSLFFLLLSALTSFLVCFPNFHPPYYLPPLPYHLVS